MHVDISQFTLQSGELTDKDSLSACLGIQLNEIRILHERGLHWDIQGGKEEGSWD